MSDEQDEQAEDRPEDRSDELVRALLRHAGAAPERMPAEVVARLDATIAAEAVRRGTPGRAADVSAGAVDEVAWARAARGRRRSRLRLLAAAAAVVVVGTGVGTVFQQQVADLTGSAGSADSAAGGAAESSAADRVTAAGLPRLHRDSFGRDAVRVLGLGGGDTAVLRQDGVVLGNVRGAAAEANATRDLPAGSGKTAAPTPRPGDAISGGSGGSGSGGSGGADATARAARTARCSETAHAGVRQVAPVRLDGARSLLVAVPLGGHRTLLAAFPCGGRGRPSGGLTVPGGELDAARPTLAALTRRFGAPLSTAVVRSGGHEGATGR